MERISFLPSLGVPRQRRGGEPARLARLPELTLASAKGVLAILNGEKIEAPIRASFFQEMGEFESCCYFIGEKPNPMRNENT